MQLFHADRLVYEHNVAATRAMVTTPQYMPAYMEGQQMPLAELIASALTRNGAGPGCEAQD